MAGKLAGFMLLAGTVRCACGSELCRGVVEEAAAIVAPGNFESSGESRWPWSGEPCGGHGEAIGAGAVGISVSCDKRRFRFYANPQRTHKESALCTVVIKK